MKKHHLLFLIIILEGYVVLAAELLAIRQLIPFVGSGTEIIAIVVSAVLLPLAFGYHVGGQAFKKQWQMRKESKHFGRSVRRLLLTNFLVSALILSLGLSNVFMEIMFTVMVVLHFSRLMQSLVFVVLFVVYPVYLLGQTVPLVSHYFGRRKLSEMTGKILFFSTIGSFCGSIISTLILMSYVGVHYTVIFTIALLLMLAMMLTRRHGYWRARGAALVVAVLVMFMNSPMMMRWLHIVSDNEYNTIAVIGVPNEQSRMMLVNRSPSSKVSQDPEKRFPYIRLIEEKIINPMQSMSTPREILVIGAGGFTLGLEDTKNHYTFVDIDKDILDIAQKHFLMQHLTPNKQFKAMSARAFVHQDKQKYDLVVVDAYTNMVSVPMEVVTQEFWQEVKQLLSIDGVMVANIASSPTFNDIFSVRIDNTIRSIYPNVMRHVIDEGVWYPRNAHLANNLYIYHHSTLGDDRTIYTDDKNTYSMDR